jgi:hypothetical protein
LKSLPEFEPSITSPHSLIPPPLLKFLALLEPQLHAIPLRHPASAPLFDHALRAFEHLKSTGSLSVRLQEIRDPGSAANGCASHTRHAFALTIQACPHSRFVSRSVRGYRISAWQKFHLHREGVLEMRLRCQVASGSAFPSHWRRHARMAAHSSPASSPRCVHQREGADRINVPDPSCPIHTRG